MLVVFKYYIEIINDRDLNISSNYLCYYYSVHFDNISVSIECFAHAISSCALWQNLLGFSFYFSGKILILLNCNSNKSETSSSIRHVKHTWDDFV